ncbi:MAG: ABC transporter substrate-binding protein [Candidatus Dormibacteraceae bacterium]
MKGAYPAAGSSRRSRERRRSEPASHVDGRRPRELSSRVRRRLVAWRPCCGGAGTVNKQAIIKSVLFGTGKEITAATSDILPGYCRTGPYPYDPGKAKALLRAAGVKNLTITLGSPQGRYPGDYQVTQAVAGYLRAVGITVQLPNPPDWPTYLNSLLDPPATVPYSASLLGWSSTDISDQLELYQAAYLPPHGYNFAWYQDAQVDQLIGQANAQLNAKDRDHLYCQALKQIWTAAPFIFLYQNEFPVLARAGLKGIYMLPGEVVLTTYATN